MTTPAAQIVDSAAYAQAVETVVKAAAAYYADGTSPMDDDTYDRLVRGIAAWRSLTCTASGAPSVMAWR
ncbi:hypothetical protein OG252_49600 [Streptomyces sp. NBC_01352]|uniref:hypothetical protein n=1 Tax=unclassified Streptomyces TaxID=2593676 RepID=UPI002250B7E0|nr:MULTISPECIES: hypothetical protein [unclassified Streptomyces]MCX4703957.1 hypothetical protein [Streptomyces sp. NBC_01373]